MVSKPQDNAEERCIKVGSTPRVSHRSFFLDIPCLFCLEILEGWILKRESAVVQWPWPEKNINNENYKILSLDFLLVSVDLRPSFLVCLLQVVLRKMFLDDNWVDTNSRATSSNFWIRILLKIYNDPPSPMQFNTIIKNTPKNLVSQEFKLSRTLKVADSLPLPWSNKTQLKSIHKELAINSTNTYKTNLTTLLLKLARKQRYSNSVHCRPHKPHKLLPRHLRALICKKLLSSQIEPNPGPEVEGEEERQRGRQDKENPSVLVTTYNVRGLSDEKKLRHLLNYFYKKNNGKNVDSIICLQESFIVKEGKLPYLWRGNFHLTPGSGHGCGCVTLLSSHLNIIASKDIENRAHVLAVQKSDDNNVTYILANVYAPNPNNPDKIDFFNNVLEAVMEFEERFACSNTLVVGDFNLIFEPKEQKNRLHTAQEKRVASSVKDLYLAIGLRDVWELKQDFTWRRPNSDIFSTIDRILYNPEILQCTDLQTVWSLSNSDHAAVESGYKRLGRPQLPRSRITRLDPTVVKNPEAKILFEQELSARMAEVPQHWTPHMKLEFAKVCIRTILERLQAERKRLEKSEEDEINESLEVALKKLAAGDPNAVGRGPLIDYIEELRIRKSILIEKKGTRLAEKLGTKWYNEGEKSTRYFMRILNRSMPDNFKLIHGEDGTVYTEQEGIKAEVVSFYKRLYETNQEIENDDEFLTKITPVSDQQSQNVVKPISTEELRKTLHACVDSAPGPDGIPYSVIGACWQIYGPILTNSWNYSLQTGELPRSHKTSLLKLIPKAGKDLSKLTNWRPITLSNCDHKLITKLYSNRMCESLKENIKERQTAYLKGRLINDNIRAMVGALNVANLEQISGILLSLDAKKAFDSVSHRYIEKVLNSFGLGDFVWVFKTLYRDLQTDIIVNGQIVPGFKILRGVKQGDSLSCILFIMCMEPLLRNIEANNRIQPIVSASLGQSLPKAYAYADDVNATIKNTPAGIQEIFREYERLSRNSGLELNADKTEILNFGSNRDQLYQVTYLENNHTIVPSNKIKINGILFQANTELMVDTNVKAAIEKMDAQMKKWTRRNLSILGKILLTKIFGISQAIFIMQSLVLEARHLKDINHLLFKFIWNRHYHAAKAPERVKREIINKPIKLGGFGMLNIENLDNSLKLKSLGRLLISKHPFMCIIRSKLNLDSYFYPKLDTEVDPVSTKAIRLLKADRDLLWKDTSLNGNKGLIGAIRETNLNQLVGAGGRNSIPYFTLRQRGVRKIKELRLEDVRALQRHIGLDKLDKITRAIGLHVPGPNGDFNESIIIKGIPKRLDLCSAKDIRLIRDNPAPVQELKIGLRLTESESLNWGFRISKLTSTKHKSTLLRVAHGDIYTKDKLHRYGLIDTNKCPRCDNPETLEHKFISCEYAVRIWGVIKNIEKKILGNDASTADIKARAIGAFGNSNVAYLTLVAETLQRISYLQDNSTYMIHPKYLVMSSIKAISMKEKDKDLVELYSSLHREMSGRNQ